MFQSINDFVHDDQIELVIESNAVGLRLVIYDLDDMIGGGQAKDADEFVEVVSNLGETTVPKRPSEPLTSPTLFKTCDRAVNQYGFELVFYRIDDELELKVLADKQTIQSGEVENCGAVLDMIGHAIQWEEVNFPE